MRGRIVADDLKKRMNGCDMNENCVRKEIIFSVFCPSFRTILHNPRMEEERERWAHEWIAHIHHHHHHSLYCGTLEETSCYDYVT